MICLLNQASKAMSPSKFVYRYWPMFGLFGKLSNVAILFCPNQAVVSKFLADGGYNSTCSRQVVCANRVPRIRKTMTTLPHTDPEADGHREERLRFGSVFASAEIEKAYRQNQLSGNRMAANWCIIAVTVLSGLFLTGDYRLLGQSRPFAILLGLRLTTILLSFVTFALLRVTQKPAAFNAILWSWSMMVAAGAAYVNSTRPAQSNGHIVITAELVLLTYCVLPLPLALQILVASVNTVAGPLLHNAIDPTGLGMSQGAVLQAYFMANFLGIIASIQLQRRKRQLFAAALRQKELTASLEQALAEIRTLRGILPICSHCKRVMNDAGAWEQVEVYVRKHTLAEFTHDICPECAKQHFPEQADR
jgi:hypothetical protein